MPEDWPVQKDYGAYKFWHKYLVYRVTQTVLPTELDKRLSRVHQLRLAAEQYSSLAPSELEQTIDIVCSVALGSRIFPLANTFEDDTSWEYEEIRDHNRIFDHNLLCVAAFDGNTFLVLELLSRGVQPSDYSYLFPSPIQLAAFKGRTDILELLYFKPVPGSGIYAIEKATLGAALVGNINLLQTIVLPCFQQTTEAYQYREEKGVLQERSTLAINAKNVETLQFGLPFVDDPFFTCYQDILWRYTQLGNLEIVRYILDNYMDYNRNGISTDHLTMALFHAGCFNHTEIVDLLLERAANPNEPCGEFTGNFAKTPFDTKPEDPEPLPLIGAASGGTMEIVGKLLDAGSQVDKYALWVAVRREHTTMVELFLRKVDTSAETRAEIRKAAVRAGLDSMADLLGAYETSVTGSSDWVQQHQKWKDEKIAPWSELNTW